MPAANELREQTAAAFKKAYAYLEEIGTDDFTSLTADQQETFGKMFKEAQELDEKFEVQAKGEGAAEAIRDRYAYYHEAATGRKMGWRPIASAPGDAPRTLGQQFVESDEYKGLLESGTLDQAKMPIQSRRFQAKGIKASSDFITTIPDTGTAAPLVTPQYIPGIFALAQRELSVRELFAQGTTTADLVSYARQVAFDRNTGAVGQAADGSTNTLAGGLKPQSSVAWERKNAPVETIATYMVTTRQAIADAGQVESLINNQGRLMLQLEEEDQLVDGNGNSPNIEGILHVPGVQTLDLTGEDNLDGIRTAIRVVRTGIARARADAILLNPVDSEEVDLLKNVTDGTYRGGNPIGNFDFGQTIWRLRRVETDAVEPGTAIVGAFRQGAAVYERQPIQVYVSDSHADFFVRNLIVILFEERFAFPVFYPSAFCVVTLADWGGADLEPGVIT